MCGTRKGVSWETDSLRRVKLSLRPRLRDPGNEWVLCDECWEGLLKLYRVSDPSDFHKVTLATVTPMRPDRKQLLMQVRRATISDQKAVFEWLIKKFRLDNKV